MQEESGLLKPYDYLEISSGQELHYNFLTDGGVNYACYFLGASDYFEEYPLIRDNVVTFGFRPLNDPYPNLHRRYDPRIRETLFHILHSSCIAHPQRAVFVMYDPKDKRHHNRKNLFNQWHSSFCALMKTQVAKITLTIPCESRSDDAIYLAMFVPDTCANLESIKSAFQDIRDELISKGYPPTVLYECF
jgi:hypothetical protein